MKKKTLWLMLTALLMLLILPMTASAETTYVDSGYSFFITPGEVLLPDYPDLSYMIGEGLTKDDFIINYSTTVGLDQSYYYFDDNGVMTMPESTTVPRDFKCYITYTPKVNGVGKKTAFYAWVKVRNPLSFTVLSPNVTLATDETATARFLRITNSPDVFKLTGYDTSIVEATLEQESWNGQYYTIHLKPKGVGETDIQVVGYNGLTEKIHVKVTNPPSKLEFLKDGFVCYTGDTIPLEIDMGGGDMNAVPTIQMERDGRSYYAKDDFFVDGSWREMYVAKTGSYKVTMTTYNGHSDSFTFTSYSGANCTVMAIINEWISVGDSDVLVRCYDENGKTIYPRLEIVQGSDIASLNGSYLVTTGVGTVTVRAYNPDGSTKDVTVEVHEAPTSMTLNASNLTLAVGESFEFEVIFDKGKKDYTFDWHFYGQDEYGLYPFSVKGQTVTAKAAGSGSIDVRCGLWNASCRITVVESDKSLLVDRPKGDFNINQTYQLRVLDKGGNVYPATFRTQYSSSDMVSVTPDGLMTGLRAGECNIVAEVVDGPTLRFKQMVVQIPAWISHDDVTIKLNAEYPSLGVAQSDVGAVSDVTVEIADPSIATGNLRLHGVGTTEVTMTANKGGAQCTFLLTVLPPDDALYVRADGKVYTQKNGYGMQVAYGYSATLPKITDYYGEMVSVKWKITDYDTCSDHKNSAGFRLSGSTIRSNCPECDCTVTATATKTGQTFDVDVSSFRLATQIGFTGIKHTIPVGGTTTAHAIVDMFGGGGYRLGDITWTVSKPAILSIEEVDQENHDATFKGLKTGKATVTAKLQNGVKASFEIEVVSMPGDVDNNDKIDIIDALRVMQYDAGWGHLANKDHADVNDDGVINTADAELILRYVAGEDVNLK